MLNRLGSGTDQLTISMRHFFSCNTSMRWLMVDTSMSQLRAEWINEQADCRSESEMCVDCNRQKLWPSQGAKLLDKIIPLWVH